MPAVTLLPVADHVISSFFTADPKAFTSVEIPQQCGSDDAIGLIEDEAGKRCLMISPESIKYIIPNNIL